MPQASHRPRVCCIFGRRIGLPPWGLPGCLCRVVPAGGLERALPLAIPYLSHLGGAARTRRFYDGLHLPPIPQRCCGPAPRPVHGQPPASYRNPDSYEANHCTLSPSLHGPCCCPCLGRSVGGCAGTAKVTRGRRSGGHQRRHLHRQCQAALGHGGGGEGRQVCGCRQ